MLCLYFRISAVKRRYFSPIKQLAYHEATVFIWSHVAEFLGFHVPLKGKADCWSQYFCSDQLFAWNGWFLIRVDRVHNHSDVGDMSNRFIYQTKNRCITFSEGRCKKCNQQSDLSMMMVLVWISASTGRAYFNETIWVCSAPCIFSQKRTGGRIVFTST